MLLHSRIFAALTALCALASGASRVPAAPREPVPSGAAPLVQQGRTAVERGLTFLQNDAAKWRKERTCATCHHGTMTLWVLCEAKRQRYTVAAETFTETATWTRERLKTIDKPRDTRPGWSMVNTPAMYLAFMALAIPKQEAITAQDLKRIAGHVLRHQEADGSWAWSSAPPKNRPPPVFESDEVATLLAFLALDSAAASDPGGQPEIHEARKRGIAWLEKTKPSDTTQARALHLLVKSRAGEPAKTLQPEIDALRSRQNKDGGWGQLKDAPSDAYATGQALYVLNLVGVRNDSAEVRRGVMFLATTQKEDGSWRMIPRAHPTVTPSKNPVPITYFGSAWATLGLMRSLPESGQAGERSQ